MESRHLGGYLGEAALSPLHLGPLAERADVTT